MSPTVVDSPRRNGSYHRMGEPKPDVTSLLRAWRQGDRAAFDQVVPLIHDELRRLAAFHLYGERPGHTFSPTDMISEAYLRLASGGRLEFNDRAHFFAIASNNMRQILVDHARKRGTAKRGAGHRPVEFEDRRVAVDRPWELVELDDALLELAKQDERKSKVVELYYFGGLTQDEIAEVLGIHINTVGRELRFSEAWLRRFMSPPP